MAHFAEILENNIVGQVIVIPDSEEHRGQDYINNDVGIPGRWIQTSYNNKIRKIFAAPGYDYLEDIDAFKPNKPSNFPSFIFDENVWGWIPPLPYPNNDKKYIWNEDAVLWIEVPEVDSSIIDFDEEQVL